MTQNLKKSKFWASWDPLGTIVGPSWGPWSKKCMLCPPLPPEKKGMRWEAFWNPFWDNVRVLFLHLFWCCFFHHPFGHNCFTMLIQFWIHFWSFFFTFFEHPWNVLGEVPAAVSAWLSHFWHVSKWLKNGPQNGALWGPKSLLGFSWDNPGPI